jgi:hypothetical protein
MTSPISPKKAKNVPPGDCVNGFAIVILCFPLSRLEPRFAAPAVVLYFTDCSFSRGLCCDACFRE